MKVKSEREVAQSRLTLLDPMDRSLPASSVHGIFQARMLEWVAIAFSNPTCLMAKKTEHKQQKQYFNKFIKDFKNGPH